MNNFLIDYYVLVCCQYVYLFKLDFHMPTSNMYYREIHESFVNENKIIKFSGTLKY